MKRSVVFSLLAVMAISGCQVNEEGELASEGKPFTATMEIIADDATDVETKTSLDSYGNVRWKRGDQVSIFAGSTVNEHYQVTDASDGKTAAALNQIESAGFVAGGEISNNVAFYPYAAAIEIAKDGNYYVIRDIVLPAIQTYAEDSFGSGAFPMVAVTSSTRDYILKFKNVLGGLKLQLKGTATITSIRIVGNSGEILCGAAKVTVSNTTAPSLAVTDETAKTVTLNCGDGVQLDANAATTFIIALPPMAFSGGFTVTVTDTENKRMEIKTTKTQTITRSNLLSMPTVNFEGIPVAPQYVDLGLPSGLKWATYNVGASSPEEYGDFFAWGETEPKDEYEMSNYTWCEGSYDSLTKYGKVDNKTILELSDDVAYTSWGGTWRMPTMEEMEELKDNCTWMWTTMNGIDGQLCIGLNGNSIFFPAAGHMAGTNHYDEGYVGCYWSSSIGSEGNDGAKYLRFNSSEIISYSSGRRRGLTVRPVTDEGVRVSVTNVSLNKDYLELPVGGTGFLTATLTPSNVTQSSVIWSSSDNAVATVDYTGKVTAVSAGSTTITAKTYDGGFTATCAVNVNAIDLAPTGTLNGYSYVDLGLPSGLKWASLNLGATKPEDCGDYYAWGETEPYYSSLDPLTWEVGKESGYNFKSYKWCNGSYKSLTKYCTDRYYGAVDNKTILDPEDDAAHVYLGGTWRMPTEKEWMELFTECTWTWITQNGVNGRLVTGPNGNSIFLPSVGYRLGLDYDGSRGWYLSSSHSRGNPSDAFLVSFDSNDVGVGIGCRCYGHSVRPVTDEMVRVQVTNITLDNSNLDIPEGGTVSLTATVTPTGATQPYVIWSSSNSDVATVDYTGKVMGVFVGTATITATTYDGGFTATCAVNVNAYDIDLTPTGTLNGYGYVDLGLPSGLKWASFNLGASAPEEYGDLYAWGETEPYYSSQDPLIWNAGKESGYCWSSYKFDLGTDKNGPFSKYVTKSSYGTVDNKTVLDPEDDAAHVNWGSSWRMPIGSEWAELLYNCTWIWTIQKGVYGWLVTSNSNSNSIFLPAAGNRYLTDLCFTGSYGNYWSSSLGSVYPYRASNLGFTSNSLLRNDGERCYGFSVRPVSE